MRFAAILLLLCAQAFAYPLVGTAPKLSPRETRLETRIRSTMGSVAREVVDANERIDIANQAKALGLMDIWSESIERAGKHLQRAARYYDRVLILQNRLDRLRERRQQ